MLTEDDKKSPVRIGVQLAVIITFFPLIIAKAWLDVTMIGINYVCLQLPALIDGLYQHVLGPLASIAYQAITIVASLYTTYIIRPFLGVVRSIWDIIQTHILPPLYDGMSKLWNQTWRLLKLAPSYIWTTTVAIVPWIKEQVVALWSLYW